MSGVENGGLSSAQAQEVLTLVRQRLDLVLTCPVHVQPGQPVTATIIPSLPEIDASDLVNGVLNLALVAKNLLFSSASPVAVPTPAEVGDGSNLDGDELAQSAAGILSGQPFPLPLPAPNGQVVNPAGVLGQLFGTVGLPQIRVGLKVRWRLYDQSGHELTEGQDFVSLQGLTSPSVSLIIPPLFRELRMDTLLNPGGRVVCLYAEGTLNLGSASLPFRLGPIPVLLIPLLIPTLVALFSEPNFGLTHDSAVLIVVPEHSPLTNAEALFTTLRRIEGVVSALRGITGIAGFLLGLDDLLACIPDQPRLRFAAKDAIPDLERYRIKRRPWYQPLGDDPNFDDRVSSILVFGMPGTRVQFFNDTNYRTAGRQGEFDIELRNNRNSLPPELDFIVAVRDLNSDARVKPVTTPAGRVPDPFGTDAGQVWDNGLSSLRFWLNWLQTVSGEISRPQLVPTLVCAPIRDGRNPTPGTRPERSLRRMLIRLLRPNA